MPRAWNAQDPSTPKDAVWVGRTTVFANPFVIGQDGSREEVLAKYRDFLIAVPCLRALIRQRLKGQDLVCSPQDCHFDVLLEIANAEEAEVSGERNAEFARVMQFSAARKTHTFHACLAHKDSLEREHGAFFVIAAEPITQVDPADEIECDFCKEE